MAKVRNLSDIQQEIAFTEFDFYQRYEESFKTSELGRIKSLLPLREMAISFGLVEEKPKSCLLYTSFHQVIGIWKGKYAYLNLVYFV